MTRASAYRLNQIDATIEALRRYWLARPELRLGQIVVHAAWFAAPGTDVLYVEDDALAGGVAQLHALDPSVDRTADSSSDL